LLVDAQLIHVGEALFDVAHFLHGNRRAFVLRPFHQRRIGREEAQLVVDHPGGVMRAEAGVFGKQHRNRPQQIEFRVEILPGRYRLFDMCVTVDDLHDGLRLQL